MRQRPLARGARRYCPCVDEQGWTRRLDDSADRLLKRRFGFGLVTGPEPSLRKQGTIALGVSAAVAAVLIFALLMSGQGERASIVLGPLVGVTLGTLLGRVLRDARKDR
jgi:hypothetical protein